MECRSRREWLTKTSGIGVGLLCGFSVPFAVAVPLAVAVPPAQAEPRSEPRFGKRTLFVITRSKNANAVYYDLQLDGDDRPRTSNPLDVYWRMYAEDGRREKLSWFEDSMAYGYASSAASAAGFDVELKAYPGKKVRVRSTPRGYEALLQIAGRDAVLRHIYVQAEETLLGPQVRYVDIHGLDPQSRQPVRERVQR